MADTLQLEIVTPEHMVINDQATELTMPGKGGYLGILPGHAPLLSELAVGEISYKTLDGASRYLSCAWGFMEVLPDKVTMLAEVAERAEDIDVERARKSKSQAEEVLKSANTDEHSKALDQLALANARLNTAAKINPALANILP